MYADGLTSGHFLLSDWSFVVAVAAFLVLALVAVLRHRSSPVDGHTTATAGTLVALLPWLGAAAVAFGLLVL